MEQLERIICMEQILDEATETISALSEALEKYIAIQDKLQELDSYYSGPLWRQDYDDDTAGKLPADLKRGVLSEDAVYNLLTDHAALQEQLNSLIPHDSL